MDFFKMVLLIVVLTLFITTYIYWETSIGDNPKFMRYITVISAVSTLVIVLSNMYQIREFVIKSQQRDIDNYRKTTNNALIDVEKLFMDNSPKLNRLYREIFDDKDIPNPPEITPEIISMETHMAMILIQTVENVLLDYNDIDIDIDDKWIMVFRQWFRSNIVRDLWNKRKIYYTDRFQHIVNTYLM